MKELEQLLNTLNVGSWAVDIPTLWILFHLCRKTKQVNSSLLTMVVVAVAGFAMLGYQAVLDSYNANNPGFNPVANFFWYMGFATINIAAMRYIKLVHQFKNIRIGTLGLYFNNAFLILALIQLAQYSEILLLKTDQKLDTLYRLGIPAINIASAILSFSFALYVAYGVLIKKQQLEELRWNI